MNNALLYAEGDLHRYCVGPNGRPGRLGSRYLLGASSRLSARLYMRIKGGDGDVFEHLSNSYSKSRMSLRSMPSLLAILYRVYILGLLSPYSIA